MSTKPARTIDLDARATQAGFAGLVGVSQQAIAQQAAKGVFPENGSYREWIVAYCENLRTQAAGRGGDDQFELTKQRARLAEADARLKELDYHERIGNLVAVSELEPALMSWASFARGEFENAFEGFVASIESRHDITIDEAELRAFINPALNAIAAYPSRLPQQDDEATDAEPESTDDATPSPALPPADAPTR
ncbi:MAG: hypothetical protein PHQ14_11790 [Chromatiales bacterium]|jgi:hypothetical protein|nr:hypothetical protein [Chromatiales bacterium]